MIRPGCDEKDSDFSSHYGEVFPAAGILISRHTIPQCGTSFRWAQAERKTLNVNGLTLLFWKTTVLFALKWLFLVENDLKGSVHQAKVGDVWNNSERWCYFSPLVACMATSLDVWLLKLHEICHFHCLPARAHKSKFSNSPKILCVEQPNKTPYSSPKQVSLEILCQDLQKGKSLFCELIPSLPALTRGCTACIFSVLWKTVWSLWSQSVCNEYRLNSTPETQGHAVTGLPWDSWETQRQLSHMKHVYVLLRRSKLLWKKS